MKAFNIIFLLSLIACLCSCSAQKRWTDKGIRKGWLDTTTQKKDGMVKLDTSAVNAEVDTFIKYLDKYIPVPCNEKGKFTPETKKQLSEHTKKQLVPAIQKQLMVPLRNIKLEGGGQLNLWYDSTKAQIDYKLLLPGQRTICPEITFKEACKKVWWLLLILPFAGRIILAIIVNALKNR